MYTIETYTISTLQDYIHSTEYKSLPIVPISKTRAISYSHNPRTQENDIVLFIAKRENEIVGFRTVLPDHTKTGERFVWMSGNWIREDMRRKGISTILLQEVDKAWNSRMMYTNYAPTSKALYDKSNLFDTYISLQGCRFYFKFGLHSILPVKQRFFAQIKSLLLLFDKTANACLHIKSLLKRNRQITSNSYQRITHLTDEIIEFIKNEDKGNFINRDSDYYKWTDYFPWIYKQTNIELQKYPFSSGFKNCEIIKVVAKKNGNISGYFQLHIRDNIATLPFFYSLHSEKFDLCTKVMDECQKYNILHLTTFNQNFLSLLNNKTKPRNYIFTITQFRNYFATKSIIAQLPDVDIMNIQDGDGDPAFV